MLENRTSWIKFWHAFLYAVQQLPYRLKFMLPHIFHTACLLKGNFGEKTFKLSHSSYKNLTSEMEFHINLISHFLTLILKF